MCNDIGDQVSAGKDVNAEFNGGEVEVCGKPTFEREVSYLWSLARVSGFKIPTVYANAGGSDLKTKVGKVVDLDTAVVQVAGEWGAIKNVTYEWTFKEVPADSSLTSDNIEFNRGMAINVGAARFEPDAPGNYDLLLVAKNGEAAAYDSMRVAVAAGDEDDDFTGAVDVISTSDVVVEDALRMKQESVSSDNRKQEVSTNSAVAMTVGSLLGVVALVAAVIFKKQRTESQGGFPTMMPSFDATEGASL